MLKYNSDPQRVFWMWCYLSTLKLVSSENNVVKWRNLSKKKGGWGDWHTTYLIIKLVASLKNLLALRLTTFQPLFFSSQSLLEINQVLGYKKLLELQQEPMFQYWALHPPSQILLFFSLIDSSSSTLNNPWDPPTWQSSTGLRQVVAGRSVPWDFCWVWIFIKVVNTICLYLLADLPRTCVKQFVYCSRVFPWQSLTGRQKAVVGFEVPCAFCCLASTLVLVAHGLNTP